MSILVCNWKRGDTPAPLFKVREDRRQTYLSPLLEEKDDGGGAGGAFLVTGGVVASITEGLLFFTPPTPAPFFVP